MPFPSWATDEFSGYRLDPAHEWPEVGDYEISPEWYNREANRFYCGSDNKPKYRELPRDWLNLKPYLGHILHCSTSQVGKVAFTQSYAHGVADRQTIMKPGRYLARYYPEIDAVEVARLSGQITAQGKPAELLFARTRKEIRHVYVTGPRSCMSHPVHDYSCGNVHPTEAYAGPDTAVAYLTDADGRVTARTVVRWHSDGFPTAWVRSYGDDARLVEALDAAGIPKDSECLNGARLLAIEVDGDHGQWACPYLDGCCNYVSFDGDYLVIGQDGDYAADNHAHGTVGEVEDDRSCCDECEDRYDEDDLTWIDRDERTVCRYCRDRDYTWSDDCNEWLRDCDSVDAYRASYSGRIIETRIPDDWADDGEHGYVTCYETGDVYAESLCVRVVYRCDYQEDGEHDAIETVAERYVPSDYQQCAESGAYFHIDHMAVVEGAWVARCSQRAQRCEHADQLELLESCLIGQLELVA